MDALLKPYSGRELISCGIMLLVVGAGMMGFSRVSDNSQGTAQGKITGNKARRAKSSAMFMLVCGVLMALFGVSIELGVFQK